MTTINMKVQDLLRKEWRMTIYITTVLLRTKWIESYQIQAMNRIEGRNRRNWLRRGRRVEDRRERSDTFLREHRHLHLEHAKKEKRESYCLLSCRTWLVTIHTLYPWIGAISNIIRERRGRAAAAFEREERDVVVLLSFIIWFPSDDTLFITPDLQ